MSRGRGDRGEELTQPAYEVQYMYMCCAFGITQTFISGKKKTVK